MKLIPRHEKTEMTVRVLSVATVKYRGFLNYFGLKFRNLGQPKIMNIINLLSHLMIYKHSNCILHGSESDNIINLFSHPMIYKHSNCILHRSESDNYTLFSMFV